MLGCPPTPFRDRFGATALLLAFDMLVTRWLRVPGCHPMSEKINPDLEPLARPVSELRKDPRNARRHSERDLSVLRRSLREHGQQKPIVVLRDGTVIAGNGTLEAAVAEGWGRLAVVTFDSEDAARAAAFAVVDNRSAELSEWDFEMLAAGLRELPADLLSGVGFTQVELEPLLRADWTPPAVGPMPEKTAGDRHMMVLDDEAWGVFQLAAERVGEATASPPKALVSICRALLARP